jgi:hypothetical protein
MRRAGGLCSAALVLFLTGCGLDSREYSVTYRVTNGCDALSSGFNCARNASITYTAANGSSEQADVILPWSKTFTASTGDILYVSAQIKEQGECHVFINVGGEMVREAHSKGEYVIATASGKL